MDNQPGDLQRQWDKADVSYLKAENYRLQQANAALVIAMRQAIIDLRYESGYGAKARETLADALVQAGEGSPLEQASYQARNPADYADDMSDTEVQS